MEILVEDKLNYKMNWAEVDLMIWEMDENLDGLINKKEFDLMYKRCIKDDTGLEPKSLFNLVQFLMFDRQLRWKITEEDTYDLIYVREGNLTGLDQAIKVIFGEQERRLDGVEKSITFAEFLDKRNKQALDIRRTKIQLKKEQRSTLLKEKH